MAKKELVESIVKLYSKLGGNMNDVLGSRSNITFLGTGKNPEPFVDMSINMEAVGALGKSKILEELKSPMGYLTADKLNDVQAGKLYENMLKLDEFYNPKAAPANIIDMGTGTRNLTQEGLGALRQTRKTDDDLRVIKDEVQTQDPNFIPMRAEQYKDVFGKSPELKDIRKVIDEKEGDDFIDFVRAQGDEAGAAKLQKEVDRLNAASDAADARLAIANMPNAPAKRANAREFLVEALKKDTMDINSPGFGRTNLNDIVSAEDVKFITEGGGGIMGDPLILVEKYFGPRILELIPDEKITPRFINRLLTNVRDAAGRAPDDPRFDRFTATLIQEDIPFAKGGLAKILEV
jgi:hypothetical protein